MVTRRFTHTLANVPHSMDTQAELWATPVAPVVVLAAVEVVARAQWTSTMTELVISVPVIAEVLAARLLMAAAAPAMGRLGGPVAGVRGQVATKSSAQP